MRPEATPNLIDAAEIREREETASHPLNPDSLLIGTHLSALTGLERTGISIVRIPPGKESFAYHAHHVEEEWIYVLSGTGTAKIDGVEHRVAAGDFMGFPTPSVAHHLQNDGNEDLVYLMGGESREVEIADFPELGKRMVRTGSAVKIYNLADGTDFGNSARNEVE